MVRKLALIAVVAAIAAASAQAKVSAQRDSIASSGSTGGASTEAITVQYRSTNAPDGIFYFGNDADGDGSLDTLLGRGGDDGKFTTADARLITGAVFPLKTLGDGTVDPPRTVDVTLSFYDKIVLPDAAQPVTTVNQGFLGGATFRITQAAGGFVAYTGNFASPILFPDQDFFVDFVCTDPETGEVVDWATAFTVNTGMPTVGTTTQNNGWDGWWDNVTDGVYKGVAPGAPDTEGNEYFDTNAWFGEPIKGASYFRLLGGLASDTSIPEPGTFALLGSGLLPLLALRRRK